MFCFLPHLYFYKNCFSVCSAHDIRWLNNEMKSGLSLYSMGAVDAATALSIFRGCLGDLIKRGACTLGVENVQFGV